MKNKKPQYVNLSKTKKYDPHYTLLIGERSNGKTYCVVEEIIELFVDYGYTALYLRRWKTDLSTVEMNKVTKDLDAVVKRKTKGQWDGIVYYRRQWYFTRKEKKEDGSFEAIRHGKPFMTATSLSDTEHTKGGSDSEIKTILFDEFLATGAYLYNEFMLFMQTLSTYIRLRDDVRIYMCGNTINAYCPYFGEMGLKRVNKMEKGEVQLYHYGDSGLRVVVYMTDGIGIEKPSNVYFAFDNPDLSMITGNGEIWQLGVYPHCPRKYKPKEVIFNFFIDFDEEVYHAEIVSSDKDLFVFVHEKTSPLQSPETDLIYRVDESPLLNVRSTFFRPASQVEKLILKLYLLKKFYYQNNSVGNAVENFLNVMRQRK